MYRTRFLVKARQLTGATSFVDALGREQRGQAGDYLMEAADGSRSIQRRHIFEDIYVAMETVEEDPVPPRRNVSDHKRPAASRPVATA